MDRERNALWLSVLADQQEELSRSLHDEVGPVLAAMRMCLAAAQSAGKSDSHTLSTLDSGAAALEHWALKWKGACQAALVRRVGLEDAFAWYALQLERSLGIGLSTYWEGSEIAYEAAAPTFLFVDAQIGARATPQSRCDVSMSVLEHESHLALQIARPGPKQPAGQRYAEMIRALGGSVDSDEGSESFDVRVNLPFGAITPSDELRFRGPHVGRP